MVKTYNSRMKRLLPSLGDLLLDVLWPPSEFYISKTFGGTYKEKQGEKNATFDSLVRVLAMSKSRTINRSVVVVEQNAEAYVGPNMYGRFMGYVGTGGVGRLKSENRRKRRVEEM